jgi:hypothetical protein
MRRERGEGGVIDQLRRRGHHDPATIKARVYGRLTEELERHRVSSFAELSDDRLYELSEQIAADEGMTFDELNAIMTART